MTNYIDTTATRPISRACTCPGTPHAEDTADVRIKLGYGELAIFRQAGWVRSGGAIFSNEDAKASLIALGVVRWNLVRPDGAARPVTTDEIERLDEATVEWLFDALQSAIRQESLPNPSGARSPGGRRASAGRTRTTTEQPQPTST